MLKYRVDVLGKRAGPDKRELVEQHWFDDGAVAMATYKYHRDNPGERVQVVALYDRRTPGRPVAREYCR